MTARLTAWCMVAGLALVALATRPLAFDLLPLKRALFLAAGGALLLLPALRAALVRSIEGNARLLVLTLLPLALSGAAFFALQTAESAERLVVLRALLEIVLFVLLAIVAREVAWERGATLLHGIVLVGALAAGVALLQVAGFDLIYGAASTRVAVATFGNSNAFAAFAAPALAIAAALALRRRSLGLTLTAAAIAAALVVAGSRGGWIAGTAGLLVAGFASGAWRRLALIAGGGLALGLTLTALNAGAGERTDALPSLGLERSSNRIRLDVATSTVALIRQSPLLGVAPGRFRDEYPRVRARREATTTTREGFASEVDHPHCELLRLAAEGGVVTAALFALTALALLNRLRRREPATRDDDGALGVAMLAGGVAWLATSLTWSTLYDPSTAWLGALLCGAALAGETEMAASKPGERWLAWLVTLAIAGSAFGFAVPTLRGEAAEQAAVGDHQIDRDDLARLAEAAASDDLTLERQYAIGLQLLRAADARGANGELLEATLGAAESALRRALAIAPHHLPSLTALAEAVARRGHAEAALPLLARARAIEKWRPEPEVALAELARSLRASGKNRPAAQLLDWLAPRRPEDPELQRALAAALADLGDESGEHRALRQGALADALAFLRDGESEPARAALRRARTEGAAAGTPADYEELLDACADLQQNRIDAVLTRLATLDPAKSRAAAQSASPTARKFLDFIARQPRLKEAATRLGLSQR